MLLYASVSAAVACVDPREIPPVDITSVSGGLGNASIDASAGASSLTKENGSSGVALPRASFQNRVGSCKRLLGQGGCRSGVMLHGAGLDPTEVDHRSELAVGNTVPAWDAS